MKESSSKQNRLVAYKNEEFLDSSAARSIRILSEYLEPLDHFRREQIRDTIVFFGSARITEDGPMAEFYRDARDLARRITVIAAEMVMLGVTASVTSRLRPIQDPDWRAFSMWFVTSVLLSHAVNARTAQFPDHD